MIKRVDLRLINTTNPSKDERVIIEEAAERFLESKTKTPALNLRMDHRSGRWVPLSKEDRTIFLMLRAAGVPFAFCTILSYDDGQNDVPQLVDFIRDPDVVSDHEDEEVP